MEKKNIKILIVDDEEDLCEILQYNLGNEGYSADIANSAEEALKKPLDSYDLILLDVMMGPMSGFKMADKLRKEMENNVPIIFLTAKDTENDILTGFSLGADDYIAKPFSVNELTARVRLSLNAHNQTDKKAVNLKFGDLEIDILRKRLILNDKKLNLPKRNLKSLNFFLRTRGGSFQERRSLERFGAGMLLLQKELLM